MEKQLLNSFYKRFDSFVNNRKINGYITVKQAIMIKNACKSIICIDNINNVFNLPTIKVYNAFRKAIN